MFHKDDLEEYMSALRENFDNFGHDQREDIRSLLDEHSSNIKAVLKTQAKLNARLIGLKL